jgi:hypothetical protein
VGCGGVSLFLQFLKGLQIFEVMVFDFLNLSPQNDIP